MLYREGRIGKPFQRKNGTFFDRVKIELGLPSSREDCNFFKCKDCYYKLFCKDRRDCHQRKNLKIEKSLRGREITKEDFKNTRWRIGSDIKNGKYFILISCFFCGQSYYLYGEVESGFNKGFLTYRQKTYEKRFGTTINVLKETIINNIIVDSKRRCRND